MRGHHWTQARLMPSVIPGRREAKRSGAASPESILTVRGCGFRVLGRLASPGNDDVLPRMSDDIPFDKDCALAPGKVEEIMPGIRRLLANNPSPFTFTGTMSYIV